MTRQRKRVYIAYTGGTIGMTRSEIGYVPTPGYLASQMESVLELKSEGMPEFVIHEYNPLLDSSNMSPENWVAIAKDIADNYNEYDGFIVLHGTDTMAYTASVLSFMLEGLEKPVVITGSQIPLCEIRNDARDNLITALIVAGNYKIPEVCLCFGDKLLRGCRSIKFSADQLDAFTSPNFPPLGIAGVEIKINWDLVLPPETNKTHTIEVKEIGKYSLATLRLFPGISAEVVENILRPPLIGLVLETYGVGNGPDNNKDLMKALQKATDRGVVIVACTQCIEGAVHLGEYAAGSALAKAGVISGHDMTQEAALTKLFYLFSMGLSVEEVKLQMQSNLRGELTLPPLKQRES